MKKYKKKNKMKYVRFILLFIFSKQFRSGIEDCLAYSIINHQQKRGYMSSDVMLALTKNDIKSCFDIYDLSELQVIAENKY